MFNGYSKNKELFCSTDAIVVGIVPNYGWCYTGCNICNTGMTDTMQCNKCVNKDTRPEKKYKVFIKVEDQTSNTTFLLWDKRAMDLVKVPAQHVLENDKVHLICVNLLLLQNPIVLIQSCLILYFNTGSKSNRNTINSQ